MGKAIKADYKCTECGQGFEWGVPADEKRVEAAERGRESKEPGPEKGICPSCSFRLSSRTHSRWLVVNLALALLAFVLVAGDPSPGFRWFLLNLAILNLSNFPAVILHELGHAVMAWMVRWEVYEVTIGWFGKPVFRKKYGRTWVQLNSVPVGGITFAYPENESGLRAKAFLVFAAGPAMNAAAAVACYAWQSNFWVPFDEGLNLAAAFAIANLICLALAIYPAKHQSPVGLMESDGMLLIKTLFRWEKIGVDFEKSAVLMEVIRLREEARYAEGLERAKAGVASHPEPGLRMSYALLLMDNGFFQEAKDEYLRMMGEELQEPLLRPTLQNNIAWANVLMGDPALAGESLELSESAMASLGFLAPIKGTRGSVLIQAGRAAEGLPLVRESFYSKETTDLRDKSSNACMIAMGEWQEGRAEEAMKWLGVARELHTGSPLLARAEAVLNGAKQLRPRLEGAALE